MHLSFSERKSLLMAMDITAINGALVLTMRWRGGVETTEWMPWLLSLSILWIIVSFSMDGYDLGVASHIAASLPRILLIGSTTDVIYFFVPYVSAPLTYSRATWFAFLIISLASLVGWRLFYGLAIAQPVFQYRYVVAGSPEYCPDSMQILTRSFGREYLLVGWYSSAKMSNETNAYIHDHTEAGLRSDRVRSDEDLVEYCQTVGANTVIIAAPQLTTWTLNAINRLRENGIRVRSASSLYQELLCRVPVLMEASQPAFILSISDRPAPTLHVLVRRVFDTCISIVGLLITVCCIPGIWLANLITSPGPLFYTQDRVGVAGRIFRVVKFRSMVPDAEIDGAQWATEKDPRITTIGRIMRKTRIDELPQFWNVLRGDMGLIGPRPERPEFVSELECKIPFYSSRHVVKPGITGWAQVMYRYGCSVEDALVKLEYDLYYVQRASLILDLQIMLKTIAVVTGMKGY